MSLLPREDEQLLTPVRNHHLPADTQSRRQLFQQPSRRFITHQRQLVQSAAGF